MKVVHTAVCTRSQVAANVIRWLIINFRFLITIVISTGILWTFLGSSTYLVVTLVIGETFIWRFSAFGGPAWLFAWHLGVCSHFNFWKREEKSLKVSIRFIYATKHYTLCFSHLCLIILIFSPSTPGGHLISELKNIWMMVMVIIMMNNININVTTKQIMIVV